MAVRTTRIPLGPWLADLREALVHTRRGETVGGVHPLRVATRRLDVWLRLGGYRVLREDLRWLRGLAGPVRDVDVLQAESGARLGQVGKQARVRLAEGLADPRVDALLAALALLPPLQRSSARRNLRRLARSLLVLHVAADNADEVHRRRRRLRRLRYALELLGEPIDGFAALQDALGVVSDASLRAHYFPKTPPADTVAALAAAETAWRAHRSTLEAWT